MTTATLAGRTPAGMMAHGGDAGPLPRDVLRDESDLLQLVSDCAVLQRAHPLIHVHTNCIVLPRGVGGGGAVSQHAVVQA